MSKPEAARFEEELASPLPDLRVAGPVGRVVAGLMLLLRGQRLALGHPRLRRLSVGIIGLNALLYVGPVAGGSLALFFLDHSVHDFIRAHQHRDWVTAVSDGSLEVLVGMLWGAWWIMSLFLSVLISRLITGSLLDSLSERTEALYFSRPSDRLAWLKGLWRSVREVVIQLLLLSVHLPVLGLILAIGLIPEVGPALAAFLGWAWTSTWLTLSFIGSVSSRHDIGGRGRLQLVLKQKALCWGLGGLCALVPALLLPLLLPGLVCGGTKLFLALASHDQTPSDLDEAAKQRLLDGRPATVTAADAGADASLADQAA